MIKQLINLLFGSPQDQILGTIHQDAYLVDVRNPDEYRSGHASGSVNIPLSQIPTSLESFKNKKQIIIVCKSGHRSKMAISMLSAQGIQNITNGGGWETVGRSVAREQSSDYGSIKNDLI